MMKGIAESDRTRFTTASGRSPRCSTAIKKMNQTDSARNSCIIVQQEIANTRRSTVTSKSFNPPENPYL